MQSRRNQKPITIRSDQAAARLRFLTRDGRSQVQVIEDALERMPDPGEANDLARRRAELELILDKIDADRIPSMAEFDAREYDGRGNLR